MEHVVPLPGAEIESNPMYRLLPAEPEEVKRQVTDLLLRSS